MGTANRKESCLDGVQNKYLNDQTRKIFEACKSGDAVLLNELLQELNSSERASALETKMAASVLSALHDILEGKSNLWVDWFGTYNSTPLVVSVENGNLDCVKVLLKYNADTEGRGDDLAWYHHLDENLKTPYYTRSFTPLFVAAAKGNLDVLSCLIENGADVNSDTIKLTPLMVAIDMGHFNVATFLIEHGANLELQDENGYTALHQAVFSRSPDSCDVLSCLIKNGADVNVRARDTCTPLMTAIKQGRVGVATFLVEHGANMTLIDKNGFTALHHATSFKVLSCLIRNGADVNACTNDNYTPLMIAVEKGNKVAVTFLIEHGADIDVKANIGGKTALHLAVTCHDSRDILNCLIKNGADVNSCTSMGKTPLMLASKCGHVNVATFLVKCGADVDLRDPTGQTALHYAVVQHCDSCDVLSCLIKHGADVNACANENCTPLMIASKNGHVDIATFLVKHGANMDLQDKNGNTALHCAVSANLPKIANKLLTLGASQLCNNRQLTPLLLASNECKISVVEELIKRPEYTKEQRIDALELLGASLVSSIEKNTGRFFEVTGTGKGFQYIKRGMKERFADPSHPLFKKPMEQIEAFQNGRESQTLEDLSWIEGDINAIITESLMIRERILGRDNAELLFVIRRFAQSQIRYQFDGDLVIALFRHAMKIAQHCNQSAISDLNELTSLLYNRAWRNDHPKQKHILELLEQTVLEYEKQQKLRQETGNESYEFKTSRDFELRGLFGSTVKLVQIIAKLKYCEADNASCESSLLLKRLSHLNPRGCHGETLLHKAIQHHGTNAFPFIDTVKLLLNAGFSVNAVNSDGDTPLHIAVADWSHWTNHHLIDMLEVLLDGGAHHDFVNSYGKTAMDMAETDEARMILSEKRKMELKCISARAVKKFGLPYLGMVPKTLEKYISMH